MARTTLKITTILGAQQDTGDEGPLLLSSVQGIEGISVPFAFQVRMFRSIHIDDIDPRQMINTPVTFAIVRADTHDYTYRSGIFQSFEKDETNEQHWDEDWQTDYRVFNGIIVPAFKLLDYEVTFRVFEDMTVLEIIKEVMNGFQYTSGKYLSTSLLDHENFPKIPYCVQYNESSFAFLSRLMAEFGIWYIFDHRQAASQASNETMVLGKSFSLFQQCNIMDMDVVFTEPDTHDIGGFQRKFRPMQKTVCVSNFNILHPTLIPRGKTDVLQTYDMVTQADTKPYRHETFPAPFDDPKDTDDAMKEQAQTEMQEGEVGVFVAQGQSKNPTFLAGRVFHVSEDKTEAQSNNVGKASNRDYLITICSIAAYENAYGHTWQQDVANFIDAPVRWVWSMFRSKNTRNQTYLDSTSFLANGALGNYIQEKPLSGTGGLATLASISQALISLFVTNIKDIVTRHGDDYSNAFIAVPWDAQTYSRVPLPTGTKPRAYGPELAVVIGRQGTGGDNDIYCDALGRVRVRFPWQKEVQPGGGKNSSTDPLQSDRRTCWVPVCEDWAGRNFGTQFLPRIGQQVLVSFLDGDPERPIITGRVYSANPTSTNLPFPPRAFEQTSLQQVSDLPATASTDPPYSGIKSFSIPSRGSNAKPEGKRFHLLRFDDTRGKEQYLIRSQKWLDITAFDSRYETIHRDRHLTVGGKKITPPPKEIGGDYIAKIFRDYHLHVGDPDFPTQSGNRYTLLEQTDEIEVKRDSNQLIHGNWSSSVGGQVTIDATDAGGTIVLNASTNITLSVGASSIVITPAAIAITSPMVLINSGGPPPAPPIDAIVDLPKDPVQADPGDSLTPPKER